MAPPLVVTIGGLSLRYGQVAAVVVVIAAVAAVAWLVVNRQRVAASWVPRAVGLIALYVGVLAVLTAAATLAIQNFSRMF